MIAEPRDAKKQRISASSRLCGEYQNMTQNDAGGVHIRNVNGGITNSIIAGGNLTNAAITVGGQNLAVEKKPTLEEFRQLLTEVQQELSGIVAQENALKAISAATPYTAKGAAENLKEVAEKVKPGLDKESAKTIGKRLTDTTGMLSKILDGAKTIVQKSVDVGEALKPVMDQLGPLVDKITVAALWASKLWP